MIGENIKRLLKENGYMQKDLAKRTGLTESTISHYVNNKREPDLESLKRLALALGVSVDELIGHDYPTPALLKAFAEIDRLKVENDSLRMAANSFKMHYNTAKSEGIKEFSERLKERKYLSSEWSHGGHPYVVEEGEIDDLVEEMTGEQNDD